MTDRKDDKKEKKEPKDAPLQPDPETLHTPDPQEKMKGPVSTFMQNIKETSEKNNQETKEEADRKRDKNM